ncbi:MAG: amidohydrolase family protein [Pseudomonadales bacterium]
MAGFRQHWLASVFRLCACVVLLTLLVPGPAHGAAATETATKAAAATKSAAQTLPLTPTRTLSFPVRQATWLSLDLAPDGKTLVMEILGDLYLLPVNGGEALPLTRGMAIDSQPRFSPDGQRIVFVSDRSGQDNLWLIDIDGGNLQRLSKGSRRLEFASPSWAPDGSHVIASRSSWGLRTFELWGYHVEGGAGVRIAKAKPTKDTPSHQRDNRLGAVYSGDGRYLYYALKKGGFSYNLQFPQWQIARRDLRDDSETLLTAVPGSAFRPQLSPDGRQLAYLTRADQKTALRLRNLATGADRLLVSGVEDDEQESRFTRDLFPGYAFSADGAMLLYSKHGQPHRYDLATDTEQAIDFVAQVEQQLGPRNYVQQRLARGAVKARVLMQPSLSADGQTLVFSAFMQIYAVDLRTGKQRALTPPAMQAFYPVVSPDGRRVAFSTWENGGGDIYSVSIRGGKPRALTQAPGYYTDLQYTPAGDRLLAIRAGAYERLLREYDSGSPVAAELVWLPARGGPVQTIAPAAGLSRPHFIERAERIYLNRGTSDFASSAEGGLVSMRFDGSDRRDELAVTGPGIYSAENDVQVAGLALAPNGKDLLIAHAGQLYLSRRLNPWLGQQTLKLANAELPAVRLTSVGADSFGFSADGQKIYWVTGHTYYERDLAGITFPERFAKAVSQPKTADNDPDFASARALEDVPAVRAQPIAIYRARHKPAGTVALVGGTVIPMNPDAEPVLRDAVVVVEGDRIRAVGSRSEIEIPASATQIDVQGKYILPGFVDTHAHFRPLRGLHDRSNPSLLANLAYGVTTGLDVQPSTLDILAYEEAVAAGLVLGPRALSTGPGIFSNNQFDSAAAAYHVLRRYRDHYGVRNLKAYIAGDRQQRQWLVQAAQALKMMPTTEGSLDMKLGLTHVLDGFSGNEHNFPLQVLYPDVVQLVARSKLGYTPTLLVLFGGPSAEEYFYSRESPADNVKLRRFTPKAALDRRVNRRGSWSRDVEQRFTQVARQAHKIARAGGLVGVGSHGQLQGLGYHWELWALASGGFSPLQALRSATLDGARIIGVDRDVGSIEPGKLADLLVLHENPLANLRATTALQRVIKGGVVYDAQTLDQQWPEQRPLPRQWWQSGP